MSTELEKPQTLAEVLNRLPFVRWDRMVRSGEGGQVYGWILRDDGRSDFVVIAYRFDPGEIAIGFTTSSATHSETINALLYPGDHSEPHIECERVEHVLGGLVENVIHL